MTNKDFYIGLLRGIDSGDLIAYISADGSNAPRIYALQTPVIPQYALANSLSAEEAWELIRQPERIIPTQ